MAVRLADAVVHLDTDDKKLRSGLADAEKRVGGLGSIMQGALMGVGMAAFNAVGNAISGAVNVMGDAITAASDLNEVTSKTNVIFGDSAAAILEWSKTTSTALGQSQTQALAAASNFAIFGQAAGLQDQQLVDFSQTLTGLASDLASFSNTTPEQAIQALGAALRGESEPIRAYGVLLDDATLKARALSEGIWDGEGAFTQQHRVLAAYKEVLAQTTTAQGDFARTADGLANQQRTLTAQWDDMKSTIGQALLPILEPLLQKLNDLAAKYLPAVRDYITNTLIPALSALGGQLSSWWESSGAPFVAAFSRVWTELDFQARTDEILAQLGRITDWFSGGDGAAPMLWAARMGSAMSAFADATMQQLEGLLGFVNAAAQALEALMAGDWRSAIAWVAVGNAFAGQTGLDAFMADFMGTYNQSLQGILSGMQQSNSAITINMNVDASTSGIGWTVTDALLTALAEAGVH